MNQLITGFRLDDVGDWVAVLACGHGQHVRHEPPLSNRPWVRTPKGRQAKIGWTLNCVRCDRGELPTENPMESIETITTERLTAERFRPEHYDLLCQIHRNPAVMATLGGVRSDETTRQNLQDYVAHWETHGFGLWLLRDRASRALAGRAGLKWIEVGGNWEIELGYTFLPEYWGRGLASEIAAASLEVGFERLGHSDRRGCPFGRRRLVHRDPRVHVRVRRDAPVSPRGRRDPARLGEHAGAHSGELTPPAAGIRPAPTRRTADHEAPGREAAGGLAHFSRIRVSTSRVVA